jgi:hypothetical protein
LRSKAKPGKPLDGVTDINILSSRMSMLKATRRRMPKRGPFPARVFPPDLGANDMDLRMV